MLNSKLNSKLNKGIKFFLALLLIFSFIFLVSCSNNTQQSSDKAKSTESSQTQKTGQQKDSKSEQSKDSQDKADLGDSQKTKNKAKDTTEGKSSEQAQNNNTASSQKSSTQNKPKNQTASNAKQNTSTASNSSQHSSQSQTKAQAPQNPPAQAKTETVTLSITGPQGVGTILGGTNVKYDNNDTVLDSLLKITREKKIHMEYSGARGAAYIEGINNNYEFDHGPQSGWIYRVNGSQPNQSVGAYKVKPGDRIELLYTTELGREFN